MSLSSSSNGVPDVLEVRAAEAQAGQRVDQVLAAALPELSRSRLQALLRGGRVMLGGIAITDSARRVRAGDAFTLTVPPVRSAVPAAQAIPLDVLFEDEHLIVLVKPAGLVVHPAAGHEDGTLVNALLAHCGGSLSGIGGVARPGIVHRLDREVSGVMVAAKHDRAHIGLAGQFSVHSVHRVYEAAAWGVPRLPRGTIDAPVGRHPQDRLRMAVVRRNGKRAVTRWRLIEAAGGRASRLDVSLETGRTHQIRVHLAHLGHPLIGDRLYGRGRTAPAAAQAAVAELDRILLHARELGFEHPLSGERMTFTTPPPLLFAAVLAQLGA